MQRFAHKRTCMFMCNNQKLETLHMTNSGILPSNKKMNLFVWYMFVGVCTCMMMHMHACKGQKSALCIAPQEPFSLFLRQDLWLDWRLSIRLGWPASPRSCLFPPSPQHLLANACPHTQLSMWVLRSKFSSWCLNSENFPPEPSSSPRWTIYMTTMDKIQNKYAGWKKKRYVVCTWWYACYISFV